MAITDRLLREFPYPFKAMLAICSDLDETPDRHAYWSAMHFLNSRHDGPLGRGLGLEVGNSVYFDMPPGQWSYWNADDRGRATIRSLIRSGHIDCLHSFGDLATSRQHAGRALDELVKHDCRIGIWVDHAVAPSNLGGDIMQGFGDVPGHAAYHADLTSAYGIRYVWRGRVTSVIGQDRSPSLAGLWDGAHPAGSLRTVAKEGAKWALASSPRSRYRPHRVNALSGPVRLRDGRSTIEFLRCNPHWGGVSSCDTADGIPEVLTNEFLNRLARRRGSCILYTHLGKRRSGAGQGALSESTREAFRRLAQRQSQGDVLVATTKRLLDYRHVRDQLSIDVSRSNGRLRYELSSPEAVTVTQLQGVSLYIDEPGRTDVRLNGQPLATLQVNPPDETGRASLSVRWMPLEFPHE
jgi:hypothetical protein